MTNESVIYDGVWLWRQTATEDEGGCPDLPTQVLDLKPYHNDYQRYTYSQSRLKKLNQDIVNSSSTPRDQEESPTCIVDCNSKTWLARVSNLFYELLTISY